MFVKRILAIAALVLSLLSQCEPEPALAQTVYPRPQDTILGWKDPVHVATAAALSTNTRAGNILTVTANGACATIDGVTLALNNSVLVKNEGTAAKNGVYTVLSLGGVGSQCKFARRPDADSNAEVTSGLTVRVEAGSTNAGHTFYLSTANPITLNTTSLTFTDTLSVAGTGDTVGPSSATDNAICRFDGTTGKIIQNSAVTVADTTGNITLPALSTVDGRDVSVDGAALDALLARTISAGTGLSGGGDLSANRTISASFGSTSGSICQGNDSRLSDSRAPNGSASGDLGGSFPSPTVSQSRGLRETAGPTTLSMGSVSDGQVLARSGTTVAGTTIGSGAGTICAGNDSRLSDSRSPTSHATSHVTGGSDVIASAVASGNAGLLTGADKARIDGFATSSTDLSVVKFTGTAGHTANSGVAIDASNNVSGVVNLTATGNVSAGGTWALPGDISPSISADQNDWTPTGLSSASIIRVDGGVADRTITGLTGGADGRVLYLVNIGTTNAILLAHASGSSSAANRFAISQGVTQVIPIGGTARLVYDSTSSVWRSGGNSLPFTTAGDVVYAGTNALPTRLGFASYQHQDLRNIGGTLTWAFPWDPRTEYRAFEDFNNPTTTSWMIAGSVSGTGAGISSTAGTINHPGISTCSTGSTSTGRCAWVMGGNTTLILTGPAFFESELSVSTASNSTDTYNLFVGLGEMSAAGEPVDGVYMRYTHGTNSGNWQCIASAASVQTVSNCSTSITTGTTYQRITIEVNAAASSATCYLDGVACSGGAVASNLPTGASNATQGYMKIEKNGGSDGTQSRTLNVDYITFNMTVAR